jgi:hypothetical protein
MNLRLISLAGVLALSACAGGGGGPLAQTPPQPAGYSGPLYPPQFTLRIPAPSSLGRRPQYVTANILSIQIVLNTVNGGAPPSGLVLSVTTNIAPGSCASGCTVSGPSSPPGSDNFTLTAFDATNGGGGAISTATTTLTIASGTANSNTITLLGIPHSFTLSGIPAGTAGTAFGSPATITLTVKDVDGNTITGTYASSVTIADSDVSSLTQGSALSIGAGAGASSVISTASTDVIHLNYGGLAILPATLTASATGATSATATFAPALQPIVYTGPINGSTPEIDLFATSGTGSTGTFTASETGWTNSPYSMNLSLTVPAGCSTIATASPGSGTSFTITAAASPVAGTCTMTLGDGAGQMKALTVTYTTSSFPVN